MVPEEPPISLAALQVPQAYPHDTSEIRLIETHISWVILTGEFAYKIKKPVQLPFLDFSTLELRRHFCEDELRLNRRLAPEIYLDVVPIGGSPSRPRIGDTPALEYAVKMRQFGFEDTADRMLADDRLTADALRQLADRLAAFHAGLEPAYDTASDVDKASATIIGNLRELERLPGAADFPSFAALVTRLQDLLHALRARLAARRTEGCIRECHGDLHLANVAWIKPDLIPFDCLEFDRQLRTIDRIDELAFLFMDLCANARKDLAFVLLNRYLEVTGDYAGMELLRLYAAHRALVRTKVALLGQDNAETAGKRARCYLDEARRTCSAASPMLLLTCGLSGSGKSTIAAALAPLIGCVHVRSDIERKRLFGREATERADDGVGQGMYSAEITNATYACLMKAAKAALRGRVSIIVDASFLSASRRREFAALARECEAKFLVLHCQAPTASLEQRLRTRARLDTDPSDADLAVLQAQIRSADAFGKEEAAKVFEINTEHNVDPGHIAAGIAERTQVSLSSTSY